MTESIDKKPNDADKDNYQYTSSLESYQIEWSQLKLLSDEENSLDRIRQFAVGGLLNVSKFRSLYWCLLLGIHEGNVKSWVFQRASNRVEYQTLTQQHCNNPHLTSEMVNDDPLSQSDQSVWNQYFLDQELRGVIKQDVHRTGVDFFRKAEIQEIMTSILFLYARDNPKTCYRQGMHEILAPVIFVAFNDLQIFEHIKETNPGSVDECLDELLQLKYLEADTYAIFVVIMDRIAEPYYRIHESPEVSGHFAAVDATSQGREIEIIEQLNRIKDNILAKHDPVLCEHLIRLNIPLSIFGVRQLRLLFGREFSMPNLLLLWDAIFAEPANDYSLVDYIFVACLVHIRRQLLESDYNTALTYLMHYPSVDSVSNILRQAQVMKNSVQASTISRKASIKKPVKTNELPPIPNRRPQSKFLTNRPLPPMQLITTPLPKTTDDANADLSDGKMIEHLKLELQDSQKIMELSQMKLKEYLAVLKRYVTPKTPDTILQVLDGMEELCSLLKTSQARALVAVDNGIEADETRKSMPNPVVVQPPPLSPSPDNGYIRPDELPRLDQIFQHRKEIEMAEFRHDAADEMDS